MEHDPFIDGLPIKNGDFPWLYGYMLNNQRVLYTQYTYVYMKENSHGH